MTHSFLIMRWLFSIRVRYIEIEYVFTALSKHFPSPSKSCPSIFNSNWKVIRCWLLYQASNLTEAMKAIASIALTVNLGAPLKDSQKLCDYLMQLPFSDLKVPLTKEKLPCPVKNGILGLLWHLWKFIFQETTIISLLAIIPRLIV